MAPAATVILMTAFGSPDVRTDALKVGAVYVLDKPFDLEQLVGLVSRWSAA
jgi:DNA-binding NtrC family response regulator